MRLAAITAALLTLAGPVSAQTPATAGDAARAALVDFCLPLFGPGPMHADRLSATASMARLTPAPTGARPIGFDPTPAAFQAPSSPDSMVLVFWVAEEGVCQILVLGRPNAGAELVATLPQMGWTPGDQGMATGPDTAADVFRNRPRGYDSALLIVANRWVSENPPRGSMRMILNVSREP